MPADDLIIVTNLQKIQGQVTVVDVPSLQVTTGQISAIIGAVDSNMDVLFRLLIGAIKPSAGSISLSGLDPYTQREAFSRQVGVLFADDNLYKRMSVAGNLRFFSRLYRLPESRLTETLEQVGLADQAQVVVEKLSPGLARRLALGRALLTRPRILLLANPFADCEQVSITLISQVLQQQMEGGTGPFWFWPRTRLTWKRSATPFIGSSRDGLSNPIIPGRHCSLRTHSWCLPVRRTRLSWLILPISCMCSPRMTVPLYKQPPDDCQPSLR